MGLLSTEISAKQMVPLCRQIATSYDAGIPILRTLELVGEQQKDKRIRGILHEMRDSIVQGGTLGEAAAAQSRYFPPVFVNLLAGGEHGGKLHEMLGDLADYYEDRLAMRRTIVGMMIYPCIQLGFAWFVGSFALMVVGRLKDTMASNGKSFSFESLIQAYVGMQVMALMVAGLACIAAIALARIGVFKYITGWVKTYVWPIRALARNFAMARYYRSMSLLTGAGVNIAKALDHSAKAAGNPYIEKSLMRLIPPIQNGRTLWEASLQSPYISQVAREMIRVGEEAGKLEIQYRKAASYCLEQAKHAAGIATKVLGFVVTLVVGGVIGYIIISFYVAQFSMIDSLNL